MGSLVIALFVLMSMPYLQMCKVRSTLSVLFRLRSYFLHISIIQASCAESVETAYEHWATSIKPVVSQALLHAGDTQSMLEKEVARKFQRDLLELLAMLEVGGDGAARLMCADVRWLLACVRVAAGGVREGLQDMERAFGECFVATSLAPGEDGWEMPGAPQSPIAGTIATQVRSCLEFETCVS